MGKLRDFAIGLPVACGSENPGPWQYGNQLLFDAEKKRSQGPLSRQPQDLKEPFLRFQPAFGFAAFKHDKKAAAYAMDLMLLAGLSHYKFGHREAQWDVQIKALKGKLLPLENEFPSVSALLTVEEASSASVMSSWN